MQYCQQYFSEKDGEPRPFWVKNKVIISCGIMIAKIKDRFVLKLDPKIEKEK